MPVYGSTAVYAEPRDDLRSMKRKARAQGHFPKTGSSSQEVMHKHLAQIQKGKELNAVQQRRTALDARMSHEMETDRLMSELRATRSPAFRGLGAKMVGAERVAGQVFAA